MLVLSSVANREAHPSPRVLVGETLRVSNFNSSSCLCFLFERWVTARAKSV